MYTTIIRSLLDVVFPPICISCKDADSQRGTLCFSCLREMTDSDALSRCSRCGESVGLFQTTDPCAWCRKKKLRFDEVVVFGTYRDRLRTMICQLKYNRNTTVAKPLASLLLSVIPDPPFADIVIPVPLHWTRRLSRGFNQSELIAKQIAKQHSLSFSSQILIRKERTKPQIGLSMTRRKSNVSNAFAVRNKEMITGRAILLIDDVLTTGATASACANVLKKSRCIQC